MASVSSATSAPSSVLRPSASAAATRARLVMLFDPGGTTVASSGPATGSMRGHRRRHAVSPAVARWAGTRGR